MVAEFKDAKRQPGQSETASRPAKTGRVRVPAMVRDLELAGPHISTEDYRSLLELSGAEMAFFSFAEPLSTDLPPKKIAAALWRSGPVCLEANRRFALARGFDRAEQLVGLPFGRLFPRTDRNARAIGEWARNRFSLLRAEFHEADESRSSEISIYTRIQECSIRSFWIVTRDLTGRHNTITALRKAEEHYRTLVERPGLILVRVKPDGEVLYISPHVRDIVDFGPQEFAADPGLIAKLLHPDDRAKYGTLAEARCAHSTKSLDIEYRLRHKDGSYHWLYERQMPKLDSRGAVAWYDSLVLDIQERKHLELQLLYAQRMETMGAFAQGLAHDYNNRFAAILGQIGLSLKQLDPEHPCYAPLASAEQSMMRCAEMTKALLHFGSKADAELEPLNLLTLLDETAQLLLHVLPSTIETSLRAAAYLQPVRGSYGQLQQVLINLAVNARDAMPKGGKLSIAARNVAIQHETDPERFPDAHLGDYVEITVTDSGEGIPAACLPYIFDPFFSTKSNHDASGLGLSSVYAIVKAHGGAIQAISPRGGGSSFVFILPACPDAELVYRQPRPAIAKGTELVLVADDDEMVLQMVKSALTIQGYRVITACDGEQALARFREHQSEIGLIFLDQTMPKLTGRQVFNKICAAAPRLPILLTSGYGKWQVEPPTNRESVRFIAKPYRLDTMLGIIRELLDRGQDRVELE